MNKILTVVVFSLSVLCVSGQSIDRIEAIIGDQVVLRSDFESQYIQYLSQGNLKSEKIKCEIIEDILFQKLLVNQAMIDSVVVADDEIEDEIRKRLNYFESQLGSPDKIEEYFGKSKIEIESELSEVIRDQFLAQKVQGSISPNVKVTPAEVKDFFNNQNKSDIPIVPTRIEALQLIVKPVISDAQRVKLIDKLNGFRSRVYDGEDFKMLATLYSDDIGSANSGGELGFVNRGDLVPEFERAAFRLKEGEISEVVESQFGFHIVQLIERRGEQINVRHILLKTKISSTALHNAKLKIEEIEKEIRDEQISFEQAIVKYSEDESANNGGLLLNPNTMSTMHTIDDMAPSLKYIVENLSVGEFSSAAAMKMPDETQAYRILKINKRIESHAANLVDDFSMIKDFAINIKRQDELMHWIKEKINKTYIKINDHISDCKFKNKWVILYE